ncbi:MAG: hypothetical protein EOT04_03310 [Candidatus Chaera renei]|uniref:Uncharacterized protein n=1 Tax=Candidatus Chaera renei TaxID=2506947 RepID=A0A4Q0AFS6_9BACT|nr:MAG: hypothetical protein EOT04_03310 [Candidatus Chaera renei]
MSETDSALRSPDFWSSGLFNEGLSEIARSSEITDFSFYGTDAAAAKQLYETAALAAFAKRCRMSGWEMSPDKNPSADAQLTRFLAPASRADSAELANAVHFMDWQGARRVESEVADAAINHMDDVKFCLTPAERASRVKVVRFGDAIANRLVVVPRKRLFAHNHQAQIVKRSVFVIDLESSRQNHIREQQTIVNLIRLIVAVQETLAQESDAAQANCRQVQHDGYLDMLAGRLDNLLVNNFDNRPAWLQPVATSFYARRPKAS